MELPFRQTQRSECRVLQARAAAQTTISRRRPYRHCLALLATLWSAAPLSAQMDGRGGTAVVPLSSGLGDSDAIQTPFSFGNIGLRPSFTYRYMQAEGLRAANGAERTTTIQDFAPGLTLLLGDVWNLSYRPTWRIYSDPGFDDRVNHVAELAGDTTYYEWYFHLDQHYSSVEQTLAETGRQTSYDYYGTNFSMGRPINSKIAFEVDAHQDVRFTDSFNDYRQWSGTGWLDYLIGPGLKVGAGAGGGYVSIEGPDRSYVHGMGRIGLRATRKIEFDLSAGLEDRKFRGGGRSNLTNSVVDLGLTYTPFENTTLRVGASRDVGVSYFRGQITERERISAMLRQRLFGEFQLSLGVIDDHIDYISTAVSNDIARDDERRTYTIGLSAPTYRRIHVSVFYRASENDSTFSEIEYSSNQYGFEVSIR